jgi:putative DNA primase/helicase
LHSEAAALCQSLASEGLHIQIAKQRDFAIYLNGVDTSGRATRIESTGWHSIGGREVFVLPSETIGPVAAETVILEGAASAPCEVRGTLADWRAGVGTLAGGHVLPRLAISAAIAGPLLFLAGGEGGGVHFHGLSSRGKTTILQAAASVWGRGASDGYVRTWRATANGLEGGAALATDTALVLDEMGVLDSREAAAAIYALANGGGKQRAGRDGALREPKSWRVSIVSSGEIPFEAKLTEGKSKARAGQMIRLLDIPADRGLGFGVFDNGGATGDASKLAGAIKNGASAAFGTRRP